jgi:hypothetical protein
MGQGKKVPDTRFLHLEGAAVWRRTLSWSAWDRMPEEYITPCWRNMPGSMPSSWHWSSTWQIRRTKSAVTSLVVPCSRNACFSPGRKVETARRWTKGRRISPDLVCPDLILNLTAPRWVLASRLDPGDAKVEFRKRLIDETRDWFGDAVAYIPRHLRSRVVEVDASEEMERVFRRVVSILQARFESLRRLDEAPVTQLALPALSLAS